MGLSHAAPREALSLEWKAATAQAVDGEAQTSLQNGTVIAGLPHGLGLFLVFTAPSLHPPLRRAPRRLPCPLAQLTAGTPRPLRVPICKVTATTTAL